MIIPETNSGNTEQATPNQYPAVIVCDWDGVLSLAKKYVDLDVCLRDILQTKKLILPDNWPSTTVSYSWRSALVEVSAAVYPEDEANRFGLAISLMRSFLEEAFRRLGEVYKGHQVNTQINELIEELGALNAAGYRTFICSGTMTCELLKEVDLACVNIAEEVWGYPVHKLDLMCALAQRPECKRERIVLLDDNIRELDAAQEAGFAGIEVLQRKNDSHGSKQPRFRTGGVMTDTLSSALSTVFAESLEQDLSDVVRGFLGTSTFAAESLPKRFSGPPMWRLRIEGRPEPPLFLKVLGMGKQDANQAGKILDDLHTENFPVARWLPGRNGYCHEIAPARCVVMESALPGTPLQHENVSDREVEQCAQTLARLHNELQKRMPADAPFRTDFSQGISGFPERIDGFWKLLTFAYHPFNRGATEEGLRPWLRKNGEVIEHRLQRVEREIVGAFANRSWQLVLGDFNCSNVLFSNGDLSAILDYEDIHIGPVELDILSFCMYGEREPHLPQKLGAFLREYYSLRDGGPDWPALAAVAKAIANTRLVRVAQRLASAICLEKGRNLSEAASKLDYLNGLCNALENFDFESVSA